ncbi:MAG: aerobic respiration control sensor protein ArcB [Methanomassiliicoccales archaeon PtaU1.Bin124]|nr:MAG: aerobic respiration control sensor protein ArcB [Methanomassiliicoccales archaeon PtaU1.Bin124]
MSPGEDGAARVLLVEDSEVDAILLMRELEKAGLDLDMIRVETEDQLRKELSVGKFDVVISDFILPHFNGMDALLVVREKSDDLPFILVSGKIGEEQAAEAIRNGANDYIMKSNLVRLGVAVKRAMEEAAVKRERRKARDELERSMVELKSKTDQLAETNRKMKAEMEERKRAQGELLKSREYMKSVIDSAPELIFSVDKNMRIGTWNKSLQRLTHLEEKEVLNRSVEKVPAFSASSDLIKALKTPNLIPTMKIEFTITTQQNVKKIIQATGSTIRGSTDEELGTLFIGRDITPNIEEHGRLIEGMGYLIKDRGTRASIDLFLSLVRAGREGMFITRSNPTLISSLLPSTSNIRVARLSQDMGEDGSVSPTGILDIVNDFGTEPNVILLDGGHYLVAILGFEKFLETVFQLSETLAKRRTIFLVRIDPALLDENKMAFIENELMILPSQKVEDVVIEDEVYSLLRFVHEQNENNSLVSLKKISSKFDISHVTVAKRIENLEADGLIYVKKIGKQRAPFLTEKGKTLLAKRRAA